MTAENDDLSGKGDVSPAAHRRLSRVLDDAEQRTLYRTGAVVGALVTLVALIVAMFIALTELVSHPWVANAYTVGVVSVLVVAITVLVIAVLRSTFAAEHDRMERSAEGPVVTTPMLEALDGLKGAAETVIKVFRQSKD